MNKQQGGGIIERVVYGLVTILVVRYGTNLGLSESDVAWLAGGIITALGGGYEWYRNRPSVLLSTAATVLPSNNKLVITPTAEATPLEKVEARNLANASSDKVEAKPA